ncbi:hypothetical protein [Spirillospora sp. CA-294931]|uniref:hypothetical protein n=1 Tax=Spirillospora sp. CA-294931 TaxID=3240042 RepID=UPI003D8DF752
MTLTDGTGRNATVTASGPALNYPVPTGHGSTNFLLHQVRGPLGAFGGVDLRAVRSVTLHFTGRGAVGLTDLTFGR